MQVFFVRYRFNLLLIIAFVAELLFFTFYRNKLGHYFNSISFLISSLIIGIIGIRISFFNESVTKHYPQRNIGILIKVLTFIFLIAAFYSFNALISEYPVNIDQSDIIPQTKVLVNRALNNKFPYLPINDWGYELFPTYQPLQWLPYMIAEKINLDYRLFAFIFLLTVIVFCVWKFMSEGIQTEIILIPLLAFLIIICILRYQPSIYIVSLENLITAYYLVLALAVISRSEIFIAIALLFCLFSRYSIVLWLPLYFFILLNSEKRKFWMNIIFILLIGSLIVYVIPFYSQDTSIFIKGYNYHTNAAISEWSGQYWQKPGEKPVQLFNGLGMAGIFYDNTNLPIESKLNSYRLLHFIVSSVTVFFLGIFFYLKEHKIKALKIFILSSLKIYLVFFYNFIQIPYDYLFLPIIYLSILLIYYSFKNNKIGH